MNAALRDRRCLVTGATGGLGVAIARATARAGCRLFLTGTNAARLERLTADLDDAGVVAGSRRSDLRAAAEVEQLAQAAIDALGGVDILINNAGVLPVGPLSETTVAQIDDCLDVNLRSAILLCRWLAPDMASRGWGRVVNVASSSAYAGFGNTAVYCASKHGLLGLSRALDDELAEQGVRVLTVSPGSIKTPMGRAIPGLDYGTFLEPAEVAEMIVRVAALDGSMIVNELRLNRRVMR